MKKFFLILVSLFTLHTVAMAGDDVPVTIDQLPATAQQFIKKYFAKSEISYAKMERDWLDKNYDVIFTDGDKLEFDRQGNWTDVDCKYSVVPDAIVPKAIKEYVAKNHPRTQIVQIERDKKFHEIELSNGLEIKFNKQFKAVKIDR